MPRCVWCNRSAGELRTLVLRRGREQQSVAVHPEHETSVLDWHAFALRHEASLVLRMTLRPLVLLASIGLAALVDKRLIPVVAGLAIAWVATTIWRFPFATPQTVGLLGIRRSVTLARAIAVGIGIIGGAFAAVGWWLPVIVRHGRVS